MQIATLLLLAKVSHISLKWGSALFHSDVLGLLTFPLEVPKPLVCTLLLARVDTNYTRAMRGCHWGTVLIKLPFSRVRPSGSAHQKTACYVILLERVFRTSLESKSVFGGWHQVCRVGSGLGTWHATLPVAQVEKKENQDSLSEFSSHFFSFFPI